MISLNLVKELRHITSAPLMDCKRALEESNGDLEQAQQNLRKQGKILANKKSSREATEGLVNIYNIAEENKIAMLKIACETDFVARNENFQEIADKLVILLANEGAENFEEKQLEGTSVKDYIVEKISELRENVVLGGLEQWSYGDDVTVSSYLHHNKKIGTLVELSAPSSEQSQLVAKDICLHIAANRVQCIAEQDLPAEIVEKEKQFLIEQAEQSGKPAEIIEKMIQGKLKKFTKEVCLLEQAFLKDPEVNVRQYLEQQSKALGQDFQIKKFSKFSF
jgi:elongation factor Ts